MHPPAKTIKKHRQLTVFDWFQAGIALALPSWFPEFGLGSAFQNVQDHKNPSCNTSVRLVLGQNKVVTYCWMGIRNRIWPLILVTLPLNQFLVWSSCACDWLTIIRVVGHPRQAHLASLVAVDQGLQKGTVPSLVSNLLCKTMAVCSFEYRAKVWGTICATFARTWSNIWRGSKYKLNVWAPICWFIEGEGVELLMYAACVNNAKANRWTRMYCSQRSGCTKRKRIWKVYRLKGARSGVYSAFPIIYRCWSGWWKYRNRCE